MKWNGLESNLPLISSNTTNLPLKIKLKSSAQQRKYFFKKIPYEERYIYLLEEY